MNESRLIEKLRRIEALFAGATTTGEKIAAERARQRIIDHLLSLEKEDPPMEYQFSMPDMWSRKVFLALLRRYGLKPYRYKRQRYTTVMVKVSKQFVDKTLWPEFEQLSKTLSVYLSNVTERVIQEVFQEDSSDATVIDDSQKLLHHSDSSVSPPDKSTPTKASPSKATSSQASPSKATSSQGKKGERELKSGSTRELKSGSTRELKSGSTRSQKKKKKKKKKKRG